MFDPGKVELNPSRFKPLISSVIINDSIRYISSPRVLKLKANERDIRFLLAYPDFNFPEKNEIEYKLDGFDKVFKPASYGSPLVYTNLNPGSYRLLVHAANNDGIWTSDQLELNIEIESPLWLKWWGILLELIILCGVLVFLIQLRTRSVMKKNKKLNEEVQRQTQLLQLRNEEISAQNEILANQRDHIQKLYNQLSDDLEYTGTSMSQK